MAYNRWIYDDLEHSGVIGMKWHHRNGPPYPLDRSLSDGHRLLPKATGSPQGKKRTPTRGGVSKAGKKDQIHSDYGDSLAARAKRKYEDYKKTKSEERDKNKEAWDKAADRLNKSDIPWEDRKKMLQKIADSDFDGSLHGYSPDRGKDAERLNKFIDEYEAKRKADRTAAKEHGTADEVMKWRDTFSKEEWDEIAGRLESEAKVQKYASKPVEQIPVSKSKGEQLYEKGSAKDVYRNRTELTVEQLETVQRRLNAENKIGEIASKQVELDSKNMERLKKVRDVLRVLGDSADSISKIQKIFPKNNNNNNQNNQNNQNNNNKAGKALDATRNVIGLINVVREVSGAAQQANQQRQNQQQQQNNQQRQGNQQQANQNNQQRQGNQQQANQQRQNQNQQQQQQANQQRQNQNQQRQNQNQQRQNQNQQQQQQANQQRQNQNQQQQNNTRRPGELPDWLKRMRGEL